MNLTVRELIEKLQQIADQGGENDRVVTNRVLSPSVDPKRENIGEVRWDRSSTSRAVYIN